MKKCLSLFAMGVILLSCSKDEVEEDEFANCELEVWAMSSTTTNGQFRGTISYGKDQDDVTVVQVTEKTYNYYLEILQDDEERDCWIGHTE